MDTLSQTIREALADHYLIERPIGRGGMATVFLAEERHPKRKVAVKVLDPEYTDRLGRDRFLREVEIVSKLTHPHIVPVFAAGEVSDLLYYVMPYIAGQSLRQRLLREGPMPVADALHVAHDVADALEYAHGHSIVHRDIKPENILLSGGHALVADFGIARAVSVASDRNITVAGLPIGTPGYMSPEQATGSSEIDGRTDIYSLGCVLYEMLYGEPPPPGTRDTRTALKRQRTTRTTKTTTDTVPESIELALIKALCWDPVGRFETTGDFARALTSLDPSAPHGGPVFTPPSPREIPAKSIAVLPFASLSGDKDNEYFTDGITDEIITQLSKISDLKVTSRTSVMRYKETRSSLGEIGMELGVATVLEGSVRRSANRVRITAQLVDARSDAHLWAETYDRDLTDIFAIQTDVAEQIAKALRATLSPLEQARIEKKPTDDLEAYNHYLRGIHYFNRFTADSSLRAIKSFEQAIKRDPEFALAYTGLARTYLMLGIASGPIPSREAFANAKEAAERALQLDETQIDAHGILGAFHTWCDWDWEAADTAFANANAGCAECEKPFIEFGFYLAARGRHEEAIKNAKRALELDPVSLIVNSHVAMQYYWARRFDRAAEQLNKTLELDPTFPPALSLRGWIHLLSGESETALDYIERALEYGGQISALLAGLGCAQAAAGKIDEAQATLEQLENPQGRHDASPRDIALLNLWMGKKDAALTWLERGLEDHAPWMSFLNIDPVWDSLRDDPRFQAIVHKVMGS